MKKYCPLIVSGTDFVKTSSHPQATTTSFYKSRRHSHASDFTKP